MALWGLEEPGEYTNGGPPRYLRTARQWRSATYARAVAALLRALLALAPVIGAVAAVGVLLRVGPTFADDAGARLAFIGGLALGVAATGLFAIMWLWWRFGRLVRRAEQLTAAVGGEQPDAELDDPTGDPAAPRNAGLGTRLDLALVRLDTRLSVAHEAATTDRLTGVANRSALLSALFAEADRAARYDRQLSIAFVDVDHFKAVNDTHGHRAGDLVLQGVARVLRENVRATDIVGRYGGEEFLLVLVETSPDDAGVLAEKLRTLIAREQFEIAPGVHVGATVSIGISGGRGRHLRVEALIHHADSAMYSAKALGRDQVYLFAEPDEAAAVPRAPVSPHGRARAVEIGRGAADRAVDHLLSVSRRLVPGNAEASTIPQTVAAMADTLGLSPIDAERLRVAALLHDLGKLAVAPEVLGKAGPLSPEEWRTVVQHPRIGQLILEQAAAFRDAGSIILHHHERFAGHGYPHGLRGSDIPVGARVLAIAEAYDAMTRQRPHKAAMTHRAALAELKRHAGTQFDPELVTLFCRLFERRPPIRPEVGLDAAALPPGTIRIAAQ
jgi:diguanylate cyclase (GGDEF)-like protein